MVGLQGRASPVILKVKSLIDQGKIGKVLSSSVNAIGGANDRNSIPASLKYFTDKSVGGNVLTVFIGHSRFLVGVCSWAFMQLLGPVV
jgi:predicted dehydrogenase